MPKPPADVAILYGSINELSLVRDFARLITPVRSAKAPWEHLASSLCSASWATRMVLALGVEGLEPRACGAVVPSSPYWACACARRLTSCEWLVGSRLAAWQLPEPLAALVRLAVPMAVPRFDVCAVLGCYGASRPRGSMHSGRGLSRSLTAGLSLAALARGLAKPPAHTQKSVRRSHRSHTPDTQVSHSAAQPPRPVLVLTETRSRAHKVSAQHSRSTLATCESGGGTLSALSASASSILSESYTLYWSPRHAPNARFYVRLA